MKMLHFWVIGVTLPTIPSTLSDLFQEASGFYSTEAEVLCVLAHNWQHIHIFATSHVPECTTKKHRMDFPFISIAWLEWQNRNLLSPVMSPEVQCWSFLEEQPAAKTPQTLSSSGAISLYL